MLRILAVIITLMIFSVKFILEFQDLIRELLSTYGPL